MTRAERIAHGLILRYGPLEAFWMTMRRVRGWVVDGTAPERTAFWCLVREHCYRAIGKVGATEVWS